MESTGISFPKIIDFANYPESFVLKVGNNTIKMILVRGGDMNMGFEGRHSLKMKSEPIHKVNVSSFYISEDFVPSVVAEEVSGVKRKKEFYMANSWKGANNIVEKIADITGMPIRLPTEAEWEFAACSPLQAQIFKKCTEPEFCYDIFDDYDKTNYTTDPTGPLKGKNHVVRGFNLKYGKFDRGRWFVYKDCSFFRIAIKAKDLKLVDN